MKNALIDQNLPLHVSVDTHAVTPLWAQTSADAFDWTARQHSGSMVNTSPIDPVPMIPGPGDDVLDGSPLADILRGLGGNDTIDDGAGNDRVYGGSGDDWLTSGTGYDLLKGGAGNDRIDGGYSGQDTLDGGDGNDVLVAGTSHDLMYGGDGNDIFIVYQDDTLYGGRGDDQLIGGYGHVNANLGDGNDYFSPYLDNTPSSAVAGGRGVDILDLTQTSGGWMVGVFSNEISVSRSAGNVTIGWNSLGFDGTVTLRSFETIILANGTFDLADFF